MYWLEEIAVQQGWNESTLLALCLEYISNQADDDAFQDFILAVVEMETGDRIEEDVPTE